VNVVPALVTDPQTPVTTQPRQSALHYPAVSSQLPAGLHTSPGNATLDPSSPQRLTTFRVVISLVSVQLLRSSPRPAPRSANGLDGIEHLLEHHRVVDIRPRQPRRERDTFTLDHKVALRPRFASIRRIRPGFAAPPGAATLAESSEARDQSILSASPRRSRSSWWSLCQTPAWLQSRSRRQQVMPLPQPISWGSISQGIPVLKTSRMPVSAARSGTRGRPPLGLGCSGGSNVTTSRHSPSANSGFAIAEVYRIRTGFVRCS
jgi:hypothetical protein